MCNSCPIDTNSIIKCKKCQSENIIKYGRRNLSQRYKCKDCKRCFFRFDGRTKQEIQKKRVTAFIASTELKMKISEIAVMFNIQEKTIEKWIKIESEASLNKEYKERVSESIKTNEYYLTLQKVLSGNDSFYDEERKAINILNGKKKTQSKLSEFDKLPILKKGKIIFSKLSDKNKRAIINENYHKLKDLKILVDDQWIFQDEILKIVNEMRSELRSMFLDDSEDDFVSNNDYIIAQMKNSISEPRIVYDGGMFKMVDNAYIMN